jgi:Undecaprenyl-phosphate glucose phosphotransferase
MSKPALRLVGAELEQADALWAPQAEVDAARAHAEAARLAEVAASFALFGLRIDQDPDWPGSADLAYRAPEIIESVAANDSDPGGFKFPNLPKRGPHIDPAVPVKVNQALDWLLVAVAAEAAALWGADAGLFQLPIGQAVIFLICSGALKAGLWLTDFYRVTPAHMRPGRGLGGLALGAIGGIVLANMLAPDARSAAALAAVLPLTALLLAGVHAALAVWTSAAHRKGVFAETVVLIGATDAAKRLVRRAARSGDLRIVAVVDDRVARAPAQIGATPVGGTVDDLLAWEGLPNVDRILITVAAKAETRVRSIIARLRQAPNRVDLLLDYAAVAVRGRSVERFSGAAVACVSGRPLNHRRAFIKRAQDLVLATLLTIFFALPMLVIAAVIKLDSKGPVLFRQRRHGFNNRVIGVLKFRTMRHDPAGAPFKQVTKDDPRITRFGAFLRRTSLDELPQLFNVLRGEMSLVGPRPHAVGMKASERELNHIVAEYAHRHRVKPGITGWAQINGSRGPVDSAAALRQRVRFDLEYVARASFWFDLQILLRTAPVALGDKKAIR